LTLPFALVAVLVAADGAIDALRAGDAAYQRGDYAAAAREYQRAGPESADPGLAAFNAAAAEYRLEQYAAASANYRRALEDAVGPRQIWAWYGLGNTLAQQGLQESGWAAVRTLRQALNAYRAAEEAWQAAPPDARARTARIPADVSHNRGVASLWLDKKLAEAQQEPPEPEVSSSGPGPATFPADPTPATAPRPQSAEAAAGDDDAAPPGRGNLPLLLDDRNAPPLDRNDALEHLRLLRERLRRANQGLASPAGAREG
jgi:tetratricopeptide (TPR) repeat protein